MRTSNPRARRAGQRSGRRRSGGSLLRGWLSAPRRPPGRAGRGPRAGTPGWAAARSSAVSEEKQLGGLLRREGKRRPGRGARSQRRAVQAGAQVQEAPAVAGHHVGVGQQVMGQQRGLGLLEMGVGGDHRVRPQPGGRLHRRPGQPGQNPGGSTRSPRGWAGRQECEKIRQAAKKTPARGVCLCPRSVAHWILSRKTPHGPCRRQRGRDNPIGGHETVGKRPLEGPAERALRPLEAVAGEGPRGEKRLADFRGLVTVFTRLQHGVDRLTQPPRF